MSLSSPLLSTTAHVAEHVVAITCVSTFEPLCKPLIAKVAENLHHWPIAAYVGFAVAVYLAGLFSARLIFRSLFARRGRAITRNLLKLIDTVKGGVDFR